MERKIIDTNEFVSNSSGLWSHQWLLLTSGDFESSKYNTMTVAWGSIGTMWNKPFAQVVVRPTRLTYEFMEKYDTFTLAAFPEKFKDQLKYLGTVSGRDEDKILKSGLTVISSGKVSAPGYDEAELIIECKKIYWDDLKPGNFLDNTIEGSYPEKDYHRIYFGEILSINGIEKYN
ncbi:MAG: flavin reductase [Bacteroidales bacterium]|jgi:flavin reductase (DIM6/NTAB) family NADH-FMN oxidoreductase RutF|nr:flavin reductase [Bacteroidales bacterium]